MDILIAYDGNLKANNVLKAFAGMNDRLNFSREVTLLNVNHDLDEGDRTLERADRYLQAHGFAIKKRVRAGRPREIIYQTAKEMEAVRKTLLVIGTSGSNDLSDYILGNSIKNMVRDGSIPMFIFH